MSIEAMAWALNEAEVTDATEVLVLIGLANHAGHDGTGARAGQAKLAQYARCSLRTLQRKLADLESRGIIRRGDQERAGHIPVNIRPVVWDLVMDGTSQVTRQNGGTVIAMTPQPRHSCDASATSRMTPHRTVREPSDEPSEVFNLAEAFDLFWMAYPRKQEKTAARKKFTQLTTGKNAVDPQAIITGAARYAADPNREPEYTKLAPTWLNKGCWEDDPLPSRHARRSRQDNIMAQEIESARAADAQGRFALGMLRP